jgi:hypothetical protein
VFSFESKVSGAELNELNELKEEVGEVGVGGDSRKSRISERNCALTSARKIHLFLGFWV